MSVDLVERLRSAVLAHKQLAEAADKAAPGPWVNVGQDGLGDAWQIHGAPTGKMTVVDPDGGGGPALVPELSHVATLLYEDGGGVWTCEAADHMVVNQPSTVIRHCDADLAILDDHSDVDFPSDPCCAGCKLPWPCRTVRLLAEAYGITEDQP